MAAPPPQTFLCLFDDPKYCGPSQDNSQGIYLGVADKNALWKKGDTLKVAFMDGSKSLRERVEKCAMEWTKHCNIKFQFGDNAANDYKDAQIRISFSFKPGESWSYLGTRALAVPKDEPTMNFGWLKDDTKDEEVQRVVLHEFGHALGLVHEHQHPKAKIQWNSSMIKKALPTWSEEKIYHNILKKYDVRQTQFDSFDYKSIMLYAFPADWTTNGEGTQWNVVLSSMDKQFIGQVYPN